MNGNNRRFSLQSFLCAESKTKQKQLDWSAKKVGKHVFFIKSTLETPNSSGFELAGPNFV